MRSVADTPGGQYRQQIAESDDAVEIADQIILQAQRDFDAERLRPTRRSGPVVVTWKSPDRFVVTMYRGEDPATPAATDDHPPETPETPEDDAATDGTDSVATSFSRPRSPTRERLDDDVISRAVHLRLTGDDEEDTNQRIRSILGASG